MRLISNIRYTFLISIFNMIRPTLRLIYGKCHFYLPWWIKNDRSLDPNYLHAPLNRTAFCESSPSIKLGPEPWQRGQPRAANVAQSSMDQIKRKTEKQKSFAQSSRQCHQIIRYQQKLALRLWRREYYGKKDKGEFYYHLPCGIGKWWHTKQYNAHLYFWVKIALLDTQPINFSFLSCSFQN